MKVTVDYDVCESNGVCEGFAPEVFRLDDDDMLQVLISEPPPEMHDDVRTAADRCPKQAITIEE